MYLLELVMQGVRGFKDLVRLRFQPAFNIVVAGNENGKTASVDAVQRMLFPNKESDAVASLISRHMPDSSRAAAVVYSDDGSYYRAIQDFSTRAVNVSKYNAATKDFSLMYKEWDAAAQFMGALMSGITEEEYARLFILGRGQFLDRKSVPQKAAITQHRANPKPVSVARTSSGAQEAKLKDLRETLRKAEEAADAEYRLEAAKIRLGEVTKKLETLEEINARYSDIRANVESLKGCENLPDNLNELIEEHERNQSQKMVKSEEMQQDIATLKTDLDTMPSASLISDKLFLSGVVIGAGSLVAGLFILTDEEAAYFPIGILASIALVSVAWYRVSRKNAQKRLIKKEIEGLEADLAEMEKSFNQGGEEITTCMQATGASTIQELRDKVDNYRHYRSLMQEISEQQRHTLGGEPIESLNAEHAKLQQDVIELEKAARALSHNAVDTYSIRQEIERIESEQSGASLDFGLPVAEISGTVEAPDAPAESHGIFQAELDFASRIGEIEMETLIPAVESAAQRNFSSVTAGKYVKVEAGQENAPAVYDKNDIKTNVTDLSHSTQELLYFCLRTGLIEALAGKLRLPFILDDPLAGLDPGRQNAACQILRTLGTKTQVILFTSNSSIRAASDPTLELK